MSAASRLRRPDGIPVVVFDRLLEAMMRHELSFGDAVHFLNERMPSSIVVGGGRSKLELRSTDLEEFDRTLSGYVEEVREQRAARRGAAVVASR